jgi:hypothetical protein
MKKRGGGRTTTRRGGSGGDGDSILRTGKFLGILKNMSGCLSLFS